MYVSHQSKHQFSVLCIIFNHLETYTKLRKSYSKVMHSVLYLFKVIYNIGTKFLFSEWNAHSSTLSEPRGDFCKNQGGRSANSPGLWPKLRKSYFTAMHSVLFLFKAIYNIGTKFLVSEWNVHNSTLREPRGYFCSSRVGGWQIHQASHV